jgi:hypothetical protein
MKVNQKVTPISTIVFTVKIHHIHENEFRDTESLTVDSIVVDVEGFQ